jgi:hypothetical protein
MRVTGGDPFALGVASPNVIDRDGGEDGSRTGA